MPATVKEAEAEINDAAKEGDESGSAGRAREAQGGRSRTGTPRSARTSIFNVALMPLLLHRASAWCAGRCARRSAPTSPCNHEHARRTDREQESSAHRVIVVLLGLGGACRRHCARARPRPPSRSPAPRCPRSRRTRSPAVEIDEAREGATSRCSKAERRVERDRAARSQGRQERRRRRCSTSSRSSRSPAWRRRARRTTRASRSTPRRHPREGQGGRQAARRPVPGRQPRAAAPWCASRARTTVLAVKGSIRYAFDKELKSFRDRVIIDVDGKELTRSERELGQGQLRVRQGSGRRRRRVQVGTGAGQG